MKIEKFKHMGGLGWRYTSTNGESLSIVCHDYSYGGNDGKFEVICSWRKNPQGWLTFGQVQQRINTINKREWNSKNG